MQRTRVRSCRRNEQQFDRQINDPVRPGPFCQHKLIALRDINPFGLKLHHCRQPMYRRKLESRRPELGLFRKRLKS